MIGRIRKKPIWGELAWTVLGLVAFFLVVIAPAVVKGDVPTFTYGPMTFTTTGNLAANNLSGQGACGLSVQGVTGSVSVTAQVTIDGTNWATAPGASAIISNNIINYSVGGFSGFRGLIGTNTGSVTLSINCSGAATPQTNVSFATANMAIVAPTDASGYVQVNCETGCGGSATATPFQTLAPHLLQVGGSSGALMQNTSGALIGAYAYPNSTASAIPTAAATFLPGAHLMLTAAFTNGNASTAYCGLYDAASVTIGTVPTDSAAVPAGQTQPVYFPPTIGKPYKTNVLTFCATTINGSAALTSINLTATYY